MEGFSKLEKSAIRFAIEESLERIEKTISEREETFDLLDLNELKLLANVLRSILRKINA